MTLEQFTEIYNGLIHLLNEIEQSPKYEELDTTTLSDLQLLRNRIEHGLFFEIYKCLGFDEDDE